MTAVLSESELRRFARLAAPLLQGAAARNFGPRASRNQPGRGLEFLDTRRYLPGDELRTIDWRQSARGKGLVVRRYRDEKSADWILCIDRSASMGLADGKWQQVTRLATALVYTLLHAGHRAGMLLFGDRVDVRLAPGRGSRHYAALLSGLLGSPPRAPASRRGSGRPSNLGACAPHVPQSANVIVLSDFLEPAGMQEDLRLLRARSSSLDAIQVLAASEVEIPATGTASLVDSETCAVQRVVLGSSAATAAARRLDTHVDALRLACLALDIRFSSCLDADRWQSTLLGHLQRPG